ncbi:hypothetical protein AB0P21_20515 [Kribbella sp. NPDC056861]|uniref:hypothetical protein n=1 Tax=Kribbella sp. NPDC056861 TaxID=3154857 RepID=UPI00341E540D
METNTPGEVAAPYVSTCRGCGSEWPCALGSTWAAGHEPTPIPPGTVLTTVEHVTTLIEWTLSGSAVAVVIDRHATPWLLFGNEAGGQYAVTVECPDDGVPPSYDAGSLAVDRGPLLLLFNGDLAAISGVDR